MLCICFLPNIFMHFKNKEDLLLLVFLYLSERDKVIIIISVIEIRTIY